MIVIKSTTVMTPFVLAVTSPKLSSRRTTKNEDRVASSLKFGIHREKDR